MISIFLPDTASGVSGSTQARSEGRGKVPYLSTLEVAVYSKQYWLNDGWWACSWKRHQKGCSRRLSSGEHYHYEQCKGNQYCINEEYDHSSCIKGQPTPFRSLVTTFWSLEDLLRYSCQLKHRLYIAKKLAGLLSPMLLGIHGDDFEELNIFPRQYYGIEGCGALRSGLL